MNFKTALAAALVGAAILIGVCSGCRPEVKTTYVDQALKDAYLFQEGSYWIFRDSVSGAVDSIVIVKPVEDRIYNDEHDGNIRFESLRRDAVRYRLSGPQKPAGEVIDVFIFRENNISGIVYPFGQKGSFGNHQRRENYQLRDTTFNDVDVIDHWSRHMVLKEHVGIIEVAEPLSDTLNEMWQLVRWNVVQ